MKFLFAVLLSGVSLFLILLVLVQRGRGGGLTGALGGMGGQSAFGTKAGDAFTRVTIVSATVWILTSILAVKFLSTGGGPLGDPNAAIPTTVVPGAPGGATLDDLLPPSDSGDESTSSSDNAAPSREIGGAGQAGDNAAAPPAEADPPESE